MSQAPTQVISTNEAVNYIDALGQLDRLVQSGKSFSGRERNCCFLNIGTQRFVNASAVSGLDFIDDARSAATVDWDHDGDLDLWISNRTGPQLRFLKNHAATENAFLLIRLEGNGNHTNRDAIGARVEVVMTNAETADRQPSNASSSDNPNHVSLVKTLHAGDGFLTQSSKWVHFGLGPQGEIDRVLVHWPGGKREQFTGLQPNRRYHLVQGTGVAQHITSERTAIDLKPSELVSSSSDHAQIWLASRVPMPVIRYHNFNGAEVKLERATTGPVLLNLWASWCQPCLAELTEFARREMALRECGLNIVALSVDNLGDDRSTRPDQLQSLLEQLKYTFDAGMAEEQMVDKLELLYAELFSRQVSLPVPSSFLIDADGSLAAIYLGPVSVERLQNDIRHLSVDATRRRELAVPFAGRWSTPPVGVDLSALAGEYTAAEYVEDSIPLYRRILARDTDDVHAHNMLAVSLSIHGDLEVAEHHFHQALKLNPEFVKSHYNLGLLLAKQGRISEAIESFRSVIRIAPDYAEAHLNLAVGLETQHRHEEALVHYREAIRADPRELRARRRLAISLLRHGHKDQALVHFRELARLQPENAQAHDELAESLAQQGLTTDAILHYRRALQLRPDWLSPLNNLAWILATSADDKLRDPAEAVRLAERASQESAGQPSPGVLDTLAAAYAAANQFDKAIRTAQRAIQIAKAGGKTKLVDQLADRLKLYQQGQPYHEKQTP